MTEGSEAIRQDSNRNPPQRERSNRDLVLEISAVVIAVCALVVSTYTSWLDRDFLRRSNQPHLEVSYEFNRDGSGFQLLNDGLGHANLHWFQILVDGKSKRGWKAMIGALDIPGNPARTFGVPKTRYEPGYSKRIFSFSPGPADAMLRARRDRVSFRLCYCSIFSDCWIATDRERVQTPTKTCEPSPEVIFGGSVDGGRVDL